MSDKKSSSDAWGRVDHGTTSHPASAVCPLCPGDAQRRESPSTPFRDQPSYCPQCNAGKESTTHAEKCLGASPNACPECPHCDAVASGCARIVEDVDAWLATDGPVVRAHLESVSERLHAVQPAAPTPSPAEPLVTDLTSGAGDGPQGLSGHPATHPTASPGPEEAGIINPDRVYVVVENATSPTQARRVVYSTWCRAYAYSFAKMAKNLSVRIYEAAPVSGVTEKKT